MPMLVSRHAHKLEMKKLELSDLCLFDLPTVEYPFSNPLSERIGLAKYSRLVWDLVISITVKPFENIREIEAVL